MHKENARTCNKHSNSIVYPAEYDDCPACGSQKLVGIIKRK
jgi:hypothetical protein